MKNTKILFGIVTLTLGVLLQIQAQVPFNSGLVTYYPFNGNANDATGNGNNGTISNVIFVSDRFGVANSTASLAGNSSSFITLNTLNLHLNPPFTVSALVKFTNTVSGRIISTAGYEMNINSGLAAMNVTGVGTSGTNVQSKQELQSGVWHHVVAVWKADGGTLYTNGVLAGAYSTALSPNYSRGFIPKIGRNSGSLADSFPGLIDEVRIYNQALSPQEISQLYQYESGPSVALIKAVKPSFSNLRLTTNYQLQVSGDLNNWTNQGSAFTATNTSMVYPQYWDVDNWDSFFFRLQVVP